MQYEELVERVEQVANSIFSDIQNGVGNGDGNEQPEEGPAPICVIAQHDLGVEEHADVHKLVEALAMVAAQRGAQDVTQFMFLALVIGHRMGLIEAGKSLGDIELTDDDISNLLGPGTSEDQGPIKDITHNDDEPEHGSQTP